MDAGGINAVVPSTWDVGDLVMFVISSITSIQTAPSGWAAGPSVTGAGTASAGAVYLATYYKVLTAADLGAKVSAGIPSTAGTSGGLLRILGVGNSPIDVSATATTTGGAASATTLSSASVTTTANNELVLSIFGVDTGQANAFLSTTDSGSTTVLSAVYGNGYNATLVTAHTQAAAGATTGVAATSASSNPATWGSITIAFTSGPDGGHSSVGAGGVGTTAGGHLLDLMLGSAHAGFVDSTVYVGLSQTQPGLDGSNITEPTATGYAGVVVNNTDANWPPSTNGKKSNGTDITFPTIGNTWGTCPWFFVKSATSGLYLCSGPIDQSPVFSHGKPVFTAGNLVVTL
jgi:hypothetical protein